MLSTTEWFWGLSTELQLDIIHKKGKFQEKNFEIDTEKFEYIVIENQLEFKNTIEVIGGFYHVYWSKIDGKLYRTDSDTSKLYSDDVCGIVELEYYLEVLV